MVAKVREDLFDRGTVGKIYFNFPAFLVLALLRRPLVGKQAVTARAAYADKFAVFAERALWTIEKDVGFKLATLRDAETEVAQDPADFRELARKAQLDFDFDLQSATLKHRPGECQAESDRFARYRAAEDESRAGLVADSLRAGGFLKAPSVERLVVRQMCVGSWCGLASIRRTTEPSEVEKSW